MIITLFESQIIKVIIIIIIIIMDLLYSPEQLAGRIVAALMHVRAVKGMALFRPSIAFLPLQSN